MNHSTGFVVSMEFWGKWNFNRPRYLFATIIFLLLSEMKLFIKKKHLRDNLYSIKFNWTKPFSWVVLFHCNNNKYEWNNEFKEFCSAIRHWKTCRLRSEDIFSTSLEKTRLYPIISSWKLSFVWACAQKWHLRLTIIIVNLCRLDGFLVKKLIVHVFMSSYTRTPLFKPFKFIQYISVSPFFFPSPTLPIFFQQNGIFTKYWRVNRSYIIMDVSMENIIYITIIWVNYRQCEPQKNKNKREKSSKHNTFICLPIRRAMKNSKLFIQRLLV